MDEAPNKREAQRQVDRIRDAREYLDELSRDGVLELSAEQRDRLDQHFDRALADLTGRYDVDISDSQKQLSLGMRIVSALGGLALCAAVFLFFYRFWGLVTTPVQVAILVLTPIALLVATEFAAAREKTLYYAGLLGVVAFASFVLNLTVLGAIFNVTPSHRAFLAWCGFALILAYQFGLRLPLAAGLLCFMAFLAATVASWRGWHWLSFGERPENFLPAGLILIAVAPANFHRRLPDFPAVYRAIGLLAIFIPCLVLSHSGATSYFPLKEKPIEVAYELAGFLAAGLHDLVGSFAADQRHGESRRWSFHRFPVQPAVRLVVGLAAQVSFLPARGPDRIGIAEPLSQAAEPAAMRRPALWLAILLVLVTDGFVLVAVWKNRSGASTAIEMTERELPLLSPGEENTGVSLSLNWIGQWNFGAGANDWFDRAKLAEVGFDTSLAPTDPAAAIHYRHVLARDAFVALEYDGHAWQTWLTRQPEQSPIGSSPDRAASTRLVAVDAAADPARLRERYPDRTKYMIAHAVVRLLWMKKWDPQTRTFTGPNDLHGSVSAIFPDEIHVPLPLAEVLAGRPRHYAVGLAYGRNFEPWVTSVRVTDE